MTFTYDPTAWPIVDGFPVPTDLAVVRNHLAETNQNNHVLSDERILAALGQRGANVSGSGSQESLLLSVAIDLCEQLVAEFARQVDESGANVQTSRSQRHSQWRDLLRELRRKQNRKGVGPRFVGGSKSAIVAANADPDWRKPQVSVGQGRNRSGRSYYD